MIEYMAGDIWSSDAEALVNPVNTVGVMGAGLALEFKRRYPRNYERYRRACRAGNVSVGNLFITGPHVNDGRIIINFPTKKHWRQPSELSWIESGLLALRERLDLGDIASVAIPALGCGHGGLHWMHVRVYVDACLGGLESTTVYAYGLGRACEK